MTDKKTRMPANRESVLLYLERDRQAACALADELSLTAARVQSHRFPDGELKLQLPPDLPARTVLYASLDDPNEKLVELLLIAGCARSNGARWVALVAPYLCYMRQDIAFTPGEAVSQRIVGRFLADLFDAVLTVDPHLHRIQALEDAIPNREAIALSAAPEIGRMLVKHRPGALLLGPDGESRAWVAAAAASAGCDYAVASKVRDGDHQVRIALPEVNFSGREVVLVDDMASTGRTLAQAAELALKAGALRVDAAVTHALFVGDALSVIHAAGVGELWSTDSIRHASNRIALAPLLAGSLQSLLAGP